MPFDPWSIASIAAPILGGIFGGQEAGKAQKRAQQQQQQQYQQYLQMLQDMYAPKLAAQEQLTGINQARLWQTLGGGTPETMAMFKGPLEEQMRTKTTKLQEQLGTLGPQTLVYGEEHRPGRRAQEQIDPYSEQRSKVEAQLGQASAPVTAFETYPKVWEMMRGAKEMELGAASQRMLGGVRTGRQTEMQRAMDIGRRQFGGAVSGHTLQNILEAQGKYAPMELQARMMPELGMQQWRAGQAQEALGGLQQMAGGGLPYMPPQPPTMMPDYSQAAMYSGLGSTMPYLMDYFNRPGQRRKSPMGAGESIMTTPTRPTFGRQPTFGM